MILIYFVVKNPKEIYSFSKVQKLEDRQSFEKVKNLKEIEIILGNMSTKLSIDKLQKQVEKLEQAAQEARCKVVEVAECKERKQAEKETREQKKRDEKSCKMCREKSKDDEDIPKLGATNVTCYPIYQQVMSQLSSEFVTSMKEEKDASL